MANEFLTGFQQGVGLIEAAQNMRMQRMQMTAQLEAMRDRHEMLPLELERMRMQNESTKLNYQIQQDQFKIGLDNQRGMASLSFYLANHPVSEDNFVVGLYSAVQDTPNVQITPAFQNALKQRNVYEQGQIAKQNAEALNKYRMGSLQERAEHDIAMEEIAASKIPSTDGKLEKLSDKDYEQTLMAHKRLFIDRLNTLDKTDPKYMEKSETLWKDYQKNVMKLKEDYIKSKKAQLTPSSPITDQSTETQADRIPGINP